MKLHAHVLQQQQQQVQRGMINHEGQQSGASTGAVLSYLRSMKTTQPQAPTQGTAAQGLPAVNWNSNNSAAAIAPTETTMWPSPAAPVAYPAYPDRSGNSSTPLNLYVVSDPTSAAAVAAMAQQQQVQQQAHHLAVLAAHQQHQQQQWAAARFALCGMWPSHQQPQLQPQQPPSAGVGNNGTTTANVAAVSDPSSHRPGCLH